MRDSASFGAASLGVLLLVGAALGTGVARTAVDVSDGLTWLPDDQRGEVVQVNPASGRPEARLQVSGGDARLEITQEDGLLVVLDRRSGQITVLDLATLLAGGRRQAPAGPATKVLVSEGRIHVVDLVAGTIANADPVTLADIGTPWRAGRSLADVVADDAGVLWAAGRDGRLHALEWSDDAATFRERSAELVRGAGPGTVLVPHSRGVTLFGLDGGVVRQVGTGQDVSGSTPPLPGEVLAALSSPAGLVPAAVPGQGTVVIVTGDGVVRVDTAAGAVAVPAGRATAAPGGGRVAPNADTAALGCARPGRPVVFRDRVYVPCRGAGKVIVLDAAGKRGGKDVGSPGVGDPELVLDDGHLFISSPGAERGLVVDADGSTRSVTIRGPSLPVVNPDRPPIPEVPTPPRPSSRPENPRERGGQDRPPVSVPSGSSSVPAEPGAGAVPGAPSAVVVTLTGRTASELAVTVSWGAAEDNGEKVTGYLVEATGGFAGGTRGTQTTGTNADLTFPCAGTMFCSNGQLDVAVTALNRIGEGAPGTRSWTVPPLTQPPPDPTPDPTTTTPPPTTDPPPESPPPTEEPPPYTPPPPVPAAGAAVITGNSAPNGQIDNTRRITMAPPADWASHDGPCQLVNTTRGYSVAIACSATTADISVETGNNRIVVRATASDGSRSVESASRTVKGPREPMCGQVYCVGGGDIVELTPTEKSVDFGQAGAGLGLLVIAVLLRFAGRSRRPADNEEVTR